MIDLFSQGLLWISGFFTLVGSVGLLRFPDFYTRCHAATIVTVGGFSLALAGIALTDLFGVHFTKIVMVLVVNLITNPTATHALADSAFRHGIKPFRLAVDKSGGKK